MEKWQEITSDKWILETTAGYRLEFDQMPYQFSPPRPIKFSDAEHNLILKEIESMLTHKIVSEVTPSPGQYLSNIFSCVKKDGSLRKILNLKSLNKDMEYLHLKIETLQTVITLMHPKCWFASIDLKGAYFSGNVREMDHIFHRFVFDNRLLSCKSLVQGLCTVPRVFSKLLKPVFTFFAKKGHQNIGYIDDSLFVAASFLSYWPNVQDTVVLMDSLGFTINPDKSVLMPTQTISFVGFILNFISMTVCLTPEKANNLILCCK